MKLNSSTITIHPNGKNSATEYDHEGSTYIEGRIDSEFTINIRNNSNKPKFYIVSVDGLSVIDGKPAGSHSLGYYVDPFQKIVLSGWQISANEFSKFLFCSKNQSYVEKSNQDTDNIGVIGVMVFDKREFQHSYPPNTTPLPYSFDQYKLPQYDFTIICNSDLLNNGGEIGTGFGSKINSSIDSSLSFIKEDRPEIIGAIYYDTAKNLEKMGIVLKKTPNKPDPFPADH